MQHSEEIALKKDLYVQLAFTLFGHVVGFNTEKKLLCKSVGFVVAPDGGFFLLSKASDAIQEVDFGQEVLMTIIKEGKSVSDMWDVQVRGTLNAVENLDTIKVAKALFEEKSPYLGSVGFLDLGKEYVLLALNPREVFFQNLKNEREGKNPYLLYKN